ncbi:response regulator [Methylocystis echinoides]|uniref:response regulator n=1 Tax=Methylocystis echinoides TaxID=29468 RepID=UPI00343DE216
MDQGAPVILLVEDSPEDTEAVFRAFKKSGLINPLRHCADGDDALDYLHRRGPYAAPGAAPRPNVILLDLNMPGTDGREVLADLKQSEELKQIPVVVLTTSSDERDIEKCYKMGANSYIKKPVDLGSFMQAIQLLKDYWLQIVILPKADDTE